MSASGITTAMRFVEITRRSGDVRSRVRLDSAALAVGRALDNDLIVDDPYVAPHHLRVTTDVQNADRYVVTDLGSKNGLYLRGKRVRQAVIACGESLRFGHSVLRIRDASETVAEERRDYSERGAFSLTSAIILLVLNALIAALVLRFEQFSDIAPQVWLSALLMPVGVLLGWAALWAGLSKLAVGRPHFANHLAIAGWTAFAMEVLEVALQTAGFAFAAPRLQAGVPIMYALATAAMLTGHLSLVQTRRPRWNAPLALLIALLPLTVFMMNNWDAHRYLLPSQYNEAVFDTRFRVAPVRSLDDTLQALDALRLRADAVKDAVDENDVVLPE